MSPKVRTPKNERLRLTRSQVMFRVKSRDTSPELAVRKLLTGLGFRYRLHRADLPGKPDIAFIGKRKAIFVHGCFWHGHGCKRGARVPKTNTAYWIAKIGRNRKRDEANSQAMHDLGWRAEVVWECELTDVRALSHRLSDFLD